MTVRKKFEKFAKDHKLSLSEEVTRDGPRFANPLTVIAWLAYLAGRRSK